MTDLAGLSGRPVELPVWALLLLLVAGGGSAGVVGLVTGSNETLPDPQRLFAVEAKVDDLGADVTRLSRETRVQADNQLLICAALDVQCLRLEP